MIDWLKWFRDIEGIAGPVGALLALGLVWQTKELARERKLIREDRDKAEARAEKQTERDLKEAEVMAVLANMLPGMAQGISRIEGLLTNRGRR